MKVEQELKLPENIEIKGKFFNSETYISDRLRSSLIQNGVTGLLSEEVNIQ